MKSSRTIPGGVLAVLLMAGSMGLLPERAIPQQLAQVTPSSVTGKLDENSHTLDGDDSYFSFHPYEGTAGETVTFELVSEDFDAFVGLISPSGEALVSDDNSGDGTNARFTIELPETGTYQVSVTAIIPGQTGQYTLSWHSATAADLALQRANQLDRQGIELYQQERYSDAEPSLQESLAIRREYLGERHLDVAQSLNNLAQLYLTQGRYREVEPLYQQALDINRERWRESHPNVAASFNNLAFLYQNLGRYREAEPLYQQALDINREYWGERHLNVATNLSNLATLYVALGWYGKAEDYHQQALEIRREKLSEPHPDIAQSLNNLAFLYHYQGRYGEAETHYLQALEMFREHWGERHPNVAANLNNLALLYNDLGRYKDAEALFGQAQKIHSQLLRGSHPDMVYNLENLAAVYDTQGHYREAEPLYQQALDLNRQQLGEQHPNVAGSLNNLASLYMKQGRYREAESHYQQALKIRRERLGEQHPAVATSLNNLAHLYYKQGRYSEAEPLYQQALKIRREQLGEHHPDVATSLNNLATLYYEQGRYREAESHYQTALDIFREQLEGHHPDVANSRNNLASLYHTQGDYSEAESQHQQALAILRKQLGEQHPLVATSLNNLATLYDEQGRYHEAEPLYQQALNIFREQLGEQHPLVATSLNNLAVLFRAQGRYAEAQSFHQRALAIYKQQSGSEHPAMASNLKNLSVLYRVQGQFPSALNYLTQGLAVEESILSRNLISGSDVHKRDYLNIFAGTTDFAIGLHLHDLPTSTEAARLAFSAILQRKGRILDLFANNLQTLRQRLDDPESQELLDRLADTYRQLTHLTFNRPESVGNEEYRNSIESVEAEAKEIEDELSRRSSEFQTLLESVTLDKIQPLIPADMPLVEIVRYQPYDPKTERFGDWRYAAYILHAQGDPQGIDLGDAETIDGLIEDLRLSLQDSETPISQVQQSARDLDAVVMQPIRQRLGNTKKLLLSPDSVLNLIPFEALVDEENRYLLETYDITYLTSGRDLLRLDSSTPSQQSPLLFAVSYFAPPRENIELDNISASLLDLSQLILSPLDNVEPEVKAIASRLGVTPLIGTQATEEVLKQVNRPSILHIATHGLFLNDAPSDPEDFTLDDNPLLRSGLVLDGFRVRQSREDDGFLSALETATLNLAGTQLVVLSACDTGIGREITGEGIYSLRRSFVLAGAQSQLISLWQVDDEITADLMVSYYDRLLSGTGRSDALHQTQLEMLQKGDEYSHPYYWASFIPSGNWRKIEK